jgi:hypothetical protein
MKLRNLLMFLICVNFVGTAAVAYKVFVLDKEKPPVVVKPDKPDHTGKTTPIPESKEATFDEALASITSKELKEHLYYLASDELEGRMSGKKGNVTAATYIKKFHEDNDLDTEYQKFQIRRMNEGPNRERGDNFTQNIFAWIEGSDPVLKNEIVVIGAHMDHIGYGPSMSRSRRIAIHNGADDNASGTVALMEIAQAFSMLKGKVKRTVVFQAYSAEEMGLIGSRYYCDNPTFPKGNPSIRKHIFMLNMDMIGYLGKGQYFAGFNAGDSSPDIGRIIDSLNSKYSFAKQITSRGSGGSDHACFYNKRVPIAFLHTGGHAYYHTPDDTADKINYDGIEKIARYAFELAWLVANAESSPRFNVAEFKEMPYVHDHGHPEVPFPHSYHKHDDHGHSHDHEKGKE